MCKAPFVARSEWRSWAEVQCAPHLLQISVSLMDNAYSNDACPTECVTFCFRVEWRPHDALHKRDLRPHRKCRVTHLKILSMFTKMRWNLYTYLINASFRRYIWKTDFFHNGHIFEKIKLNNSNKIINFPILEILHLLLRFNCNI